MTMVACSSSSSSSSLPDTVSTTTLLRVKRLVSAAGIFALAMTQLLGIQQAYNMTRDFRFNTSSSIPALEQLIDATALVTKIVTTSSFPAAGRPGIQWKNRNYMSHPVTAAESRYISFMTIENAKRMNHSKILKVAICHPTMFGDLLLDTYFAWVSYYRLLGFDHIFLWYEENISKLPRFHELAALPYVTLTLHNYSDTTGTKEVYHGQTTVEKECFTMANHSGFDWALPIDVDEYIWFQKPQSIQDFLTHYEQQGLAYISLGKHHYSTRHVYRSPDDDEDDDADAGFGLEQYPYTPGTYCNRNPGNFRCPNWLGRSKVLAKPSRFNHVNIHGFGNHHKRHYGTHLNTSVAHFKEWVNLTSRRRRLHDSLGSDKDDDDDDDTIYHNDTQSFQSSTREHAGIYDLLRSHPLNEAGKVTINNDGDKLREWCRFVARGAAAATMAGSQE